MRKGKLQVRATSSQIADFLKEQVRAGLWGDRLPSERSFSEQLGISRRSLRGALAELQREGLIVERSQLGTKIAPRRARKRIHQISVGVVVPKSSRDILGSALFFLDEMRKFFEARQINMQIHRARYLPGDAVATDFEKTIRENAHACWILVSPMAPMQRWCKQNGVRAMVVGIGDHDFPSISVDYHALCRHAAGEMLRLGHRRLAIILPNNEKIEDVQSCLGFQAGLESSSHSDVLITREYHDQTTRGVCLLADRLLRRNQGPTAWLVCRQGHFVTMLTYLLHRGIKIPSQISLVSRNTDVFADDIVPSPSRYVINDKSYARKCARLALKVIDGHASEEEVVSIMPDFLPGETLGLIGAGGGGRSER